MRNDFLFPLLDLDISLSDKMLEDLGAVLPERVIQEYIEKEKVRIRSDKWWIWGQRNFKNEDESPWEMSPGELAIFRLIVLRQHPRSQVISSTQYGKSLTIERALLTRITTFPEDWLILVPDTKRGEIIIRYMIHDTSQNEYFTNKLFGVNADDTLLMRLLEEKSKKKLTYQIIEDDKVPRYGSAEIITTDARRKQNAIASIMGFGGRNIIADESALTVDEVDAGVFRMLAGKGEDTFLIKVGNPFYRNHFLSSWKDKRYKKIFIDQVIGLCEGRYVESFLEEAREKPQADILYRSAFPKADAVDSEGWMSLLTEEEVHLSMQEAPHFGEDRLGVDISDQGDNESVIVKRSSGYAEVLFGDNEIDTMDFAGQIVLKSAEVTSKKIYGDRVGVGGPVLARVREVNTVDRLGLKLIEVNAGEEPTDKKRYFNKRAEMFWRAREWIKSGGKLSNDQRWYQLAQVKYRATSRGTIQIMPKDTMRKNGIASPDVADGFSMTFYDPMVATLVSEEDKQFMRTMQKIQQQDRRSKFRRVNRPSFMPPR